MTELSSALVGKASREWVWFPDDATKVDTEEYLLVRFPDWFASPLELMRVTPGARPVAEVLDEAIARAREFGVAQVDVWVKLDAPEGLDTLLTGRGGVRHETLDVLARPLDPGALPELAVPEDVEVRELTDLEVVRDGQRIDVEVLGGSLPSEDRMRAIRDETEAELRAGMGGRFVAYVGGEPAGSGGLAMAEPPEGASGRVARLWGGAVREQLRGHGVYRAILAERFRYAVEHGASMALVKGRIETSGPILRRAGFTGYGQERSYRIPLGGSSGRD